MALLFRIVSGRARQLPSSHRPEAGADDWPDPADLGGMAVVRMDGATEDDYPATAFAAWYTSAGSSRSNRQMISIGRSSR
jgi:hypothetical protein